MAGDSTGFANWWVDDLIYIKVTNGDHLNYRTYYSWGQLLPPVDVSSLFYDGENVVYVKLANDPIHFNYVGCSELWLVKRKATKDETSVTEINFHMPKNDSLNIVHTNLPQTYGLNSSYPNPMTNSVAIGFQIPSAKRVSLKIYNINGQLVKTLLDEIKNSGYYNIIWDGCDVNGKRVSQGVYLYKMSAGNYSDTKKLILLR